MNQPVTFATEDDGQGGVGFLAHLPTILWQRRLLILVPVLVGVLAAITAIFAIPPVYRSSALMLVESPQLPNEVIGGGSEMIDRRIARIKEQVTSRPDLVALIDEHGLYAEERRRRPLSEIIKKMREAITLSPTTFNAPSNPAEQRPIAFELAFNYKSPGEAQAVAQDLMERILELDSTGSAEQATNTVQFLADQAKGLETQIDDVQRQMAAISARNGGVLAGGGMGMVVNSNSGSFDVQIAALQRENTALLAQRDIAKTSATRDPAVVAAENALAAARSVYSESHPDVALAKQRLAEVQALAKTESRKPPIDLTVRSQRCEPHVPRTQPKSPRP
jgi:uncharacterized protein involved in exopolysaccharide biosynthesis